MMTRRPPRRPLVLATGAAFLLIALLHSLGYLALRPLLAPVPADLRPLMPLLWASFAVHYVVLGIVLLIAGRSTVWGGRGLLVPVALVPIVDAVLQIITIGFGLPAGMLLGAGLLGLTAAARDDHPSP